MVCKAIFKQNIGHLGEDIVIVGVHWNYMTMRLQWKAAHTAFFDRLHAQIRSSGIQFLCGDFNMSLTDVPKQLARRGLACDCVAWYPWKPRGAFPDIKDPANTPFFGLDSCAIFYIGGTVSVKLHYGLEAFDRLSAVGYVNDDRILDEYTADNFPGQFWTSYRSTTTESDVRVPVDLTNASCLRDKVKDLLNPSITKQCLTAMPKRPGTFYFPYLKLKEKRMDKSEWLVDGQMHSGSHYSLCVFTDNWSARSNQSERNRAMGKGKGGRVTYARVAGGQGRNAAQSGKGKSSQEDTGSVSSQWQDVSSSISSSSVQYRHSGGRDSNDRPRSNARDNDQFQGAGSWPYPDLIQGNHLGFQMLSTARPNTTPPGLN